MEWAIVGILRPKTRIREPLLKSMAILNFSLFRNDKRGCINAVSAGMRKSDRGTIFRLADLPRNCFAAAGTPSFRRAVPNAHKFGQKLPL